MASRALHVLHVLASNQRRGAEVFAADCGVALRERGVRQTFAHIRASADPTTVYPGETVHLGGDGRSPVGPAGKLRGLASRIAPDVVLVHGGEALRLAVLAGVGRRRLVYRRIGSAPPAIRQGLRRRWHRGLLRRAERIICVSEATRLETLELFGLDPTRVLAVPNAVDPNRVRLPDKLHARASLSLPAEAVVTVSVGALSWEKRPLEVLGALRPCVAEDARWWHVFVGEGPMRDELEAAIPADLRSRIRVLGGREDVGTALAAADVFVFGSGADSIEGMPASLIEAGLAGLPVVATSVAGVPEVVVHGETGLLVPPGGLPEVGALVTRLLGDDDLRTRLGAAAQLRCSERFTIEAVAPRYVEVFESIAG